MYTHISLIILMDWTIESLSQQDLQDQSQYKNMSLNLIFKDKMENTKWNSCQKMLST